MVCSNDTPASMLGNLITDLVKGNVDGRFLREVVEGVRHHRQADLFTDQHEIFNASRKLISSSRLRYAGVIIDVLYDHFLTVNWGRFCSVGLDEFVGRVYENLWSHQVPVLHPVPIVIEKMVREDWLRSYGIAERIDRTFRRSSGRLQRENTLDTAVDELERNYSLLQDQFLCFFPQLAARFRTHEREVARVPGNEKHPLHPVVTGP